MQSKFTYSVVPQIPARIESLRDIAYNLWWSWNPVASELFRDIDPLLWEKYGHNPVKMLRNIEQEKLTEAAGRDSIVGRIDAIRQRLQDYLHKGDRWYHKNRGEAGDGFQIAYFSAEFGIHEALPIYSGGLGILAGDHCKSASDLGLPFVACGLLYRLGYFKQRINKDGWQESESVVWSFHDLPIAEARHAESGEPVVVSVDLPGRRVFIKVWHATIGNIRIVLLDTDVSQNSEEDRKITYQLYGGDHEMRIKQEIVLGVGGTRALQALGIKPTVYHMNEGHAAFLGLERIRQLVQEHGLKFNEALQVVASSNVFTTHTPVPAGNDAFSPELVRRYFADFVAQMGVPFEALLKIGRPWQGGDNEPFSMTILGLRLSRYCNGVSALHGDVSRGLWLCVWPGVPKHEIPITSITNGVHTQTWMSPEFRRLLEDHVGPIWEECVQSGEAWKPVFNIPDAEMWETHQERKRKLIEKVRSRVQNQRLREELSPDYIADAQHLLNPEVLTIGFARRFATYKRATLLLKNIDRFKEIISNSQRPVQFVFAGKAHPADEPGKKFLQAVYKTSEDPAFRNKLIFVEDYDIDLARYLVSGVDVWLNTPTRPLEASGTSGQKGPINGIVNCSILDGWWCEGWNGRNGFAINKDVVSVNPATQDEFDANSLYTILEQEIIPRYYERNEQGIPHRWIQVMKESMASISPQFSTFRMVQDYTRRLYMPAHSGHMKMRADNFANARDLAAWKEMIRQTWYQVKINDVRWDRKTAHTVGETFDVSARVTLGGIKPEHVLVEAYVEEDADAADFSCFELSKAEDLGSGLYLYRGRIECRQSGSYNFNVRVLPHHPALTQKHELRLITWNESFA